MLKKTISFCSVLVALAAILLVGYGIRTACPDVASYVFCEQGER